MDAMLPSSFCVGKPCLIAICLLPLMAPGQRLSASLTAKGRLDSALPVIYLLIEARQVLRDSWNFVAAALIERILPSAVQVSIFPDSHVSNSRGLSLKLPVTPPFFEHHTKTAKVCRTTA